MTTIYILYPHNTEEDCINEVNQLGQFSYPKHYIKEKLFTRKEIFTKLAGYHILEELIRKESRVLSHVRIVSSTGKEYTIEKFLDLISRVDVLR